MDESQSEYQTFTSPQLYIEHAGEQYVSEIMTAVEKMPWGVTLLQLAWTAGPVTFIALQGGYYIGYGTLAPIGLLLYFIAYTMIAGLIGVAAGIAHKIKQKKRKREVETNLLFVIDSLSDLMIYTHDFRLSGLKQKERKYDAATILLKNSHPLPGAVYTAVKDITNDSRLAQHAEKLEVFRRSGLFTRRNDLAHTLDSRRKKIIRKLRNARPELAHYLDLRLQGKSPSLKEGVPRPDGFLERIFLASETNNLTLMTNRDADALFSFIYELINGREIIILNFQFIGNKKLRKAASSIEKKRASYRLSRSLIDHHTQALKSLLIKHDLLPNNPHENLNEFYEKATLCVDNVAKTLIHSTDEERQTVSYLEQCQLFLNIILHYTFIRDAYKSYSTQAQLYQHAIERWKNIRASMTNGRSLFNLVRKNRGLRIAEKTIALDDEEKLQCAKKIAPILEEHFQNHPDHLTYSQDNIKQVAISMMRAISGMLKLSNPINQYGIESSNAANLSSLEQGISVQAKIGWSSGMVTEVEKNLGKTVETLAKVLVQQYEEALDDEAIDFLHTTYGADKTALNQINQSHRATDPATHSSYHQISTIKKLSQQWLQAKELAEHTVNAHSVFYPETDAS